MRAPRSDDVLTVLTSFPRPRVTTNPYIVQLAESLEQEPGVRVVYFGWRVALTGRYDVVHLHWPETWLEGRTRVRRSARLLLATLLCLRLAVTGSGVVRTWHNLERPHGLWRADYLVLAWLERLTRVRIRLNEVTVLPDGASCVTIPHGHYRDWFARYPQHSPVPGRAAFVGRIRRYKGVEHLVEVFTEIADPSLSLTVAGMPSSRELVDIVTTLAGDDGRVALRFEYVDEATLAAVVTESSLVVLPYRHMHNSGTVLAALSLDRGVLVPDNEVNRRLADEVGPGWVHLYDGELDADDLTGALSAARPQSRPDLGARDWDAAGRQHVEAYRLALAPRGSR